MTNEKLCEPCSYLGDTTPAPYVTGWDFTPTCIFHRERSWNERAPRLDREKLWREAGIPEAAWPELEALIQRHARSADAFAVTLMVTLDVPDPHMTPTTRNCHTPDAVLAWFERLVNGSHPWGVHIDIKRLSVSGPGKPDLSGVGE